MRRLIEVLVLTAAVFWLTPGGAPSAYAQADTRGANPAADAVQLDPAAQLIGMDDVGMGSLLLRSIQPGRYVEAPRVATDVEIDVTGPIVRARVTQRFYNPTDAWVEGVYVFPLPEDAGVDTLKMIIGDRFIDGVIKEREEARVIYEEARAAGQKASLIEQERPNVFTNSVANIGPGETVVVQIEYQDVARLDDGVFSLRYPMVVGPRYIPEPDLVQMVDLDGATGFAVNDPVPDADRITPPVMKPENEPDEMLRLPVTMQVNLRAGFTLGAVDSLYHEVAIDETGSDRAVITFAADEVPANRDFALEWSAADAERPHAALFTEERDGEQYFLAMVTPPAQLGATAPRRPRDAVFVIDNSGSMSGPSMPQAKAALMIALERLDPSDRFNVVRFDDTYDVVFPAGAVPATEENVAYAMRFVAGLEANGGTEMLPALRAALNDAHPGDVDRVRQVVFLTDGAIGNEDELFTAIDDGLGRSRLFTVGIGSAPNSFFMTRAARIGRGTFTHIGDLDEVQTKTVALLEALERPVMTNLAVQFPPGSTVQAWPSPLPDLYAGEPVVVSAKVDKNQGFMRVSGDLAGTRWAADLPLAKAAPGKGVSTVWGRAKIADIEETRYTGADWEAVDRAVLETALEFSLVSRLTSLVAVDVTPSRPENVTIETRDIPTMLPDGWDFEKVFGPDVTTPDLTQTRADLGGPTLAALAVRTDPNAPLADVRGVPLPQGSTPAALRMGLGALIMLIGLVLAAAAFAPSRRRTGA